MAQNYVPEDKLIDCCECGEQFVFNGGEQLYYRDRGLAQPRRCQSCRAKKRARQAELEAKGMAVKVDAPAA